MSRTWIFFTCLLAVVCEAGYLSSASAQQSDFDRAKRRLVGEWTTSSGRSITFFISGGSAKFQDNVAPGQVLEGGFRQGEAGADYVLIYPSTPANPVGLECTYKVTFPTRDDGDSIILGLRDARPFEGRQRCIEGKLDRVH